MSKSLSISSDLPIFAELTADEIAVVASVMTQETYETDAVLFAEGDSAGAVYIVLEGAIRVSTVIIGDVENTLLTLRTGGVFGEIAMLTGEVRSGTARAIEDTTIAALSNDAYQSIIKDHPGIGAKLMNYLVHTAAKRLRHTTDLYKQAEQWGLSISGVVELNYSQLIAEHITVRIELIDQRSVVGMIVRVETGTIGTELLVKTVEDKFVIIPYAAVVMISFDT